MTSSHLYKAWTKAVQVQCETQIKCDNNHFIKQKTPLVCTWRHFVFISILQGPCTGKNATYGHIVVWCDTIWIVKDYFITTAGCALVVPVTSQAKLLCSPNKRLTNKYRWKTRCLQGSFFKTQTWNIIIMMFFLHPYVWQLLSFFWAL